MTLIKRRLQSTIVGDLNKKMVIVSGPRQSGKTVLSKQILKKLDGDYYNFDIPEHRKLILNSKLNAGGSLWILEEIHKYRGWRNYLKGLYDEHHDVKKILVTGSAKLDAYSRGGDSLQGRYFQHRLHPLTFSEILGISFDSSKQVPEISNSIPSGAVGTLKDLLNYGGFPEPFLAESQREANRWRFQYRDRLIKEEVRSLERILDLDKLDLLLERLPHCVGSPLSLNSFREDLEVSFDSVKKWISVFDNLYITFRISPFGSTRIKAVKKEQKLYFWDWAAVEQESFRIENLVAMHLLRFVHWTEDVEGCKMELRYYRSPMAHEVDFVLIKEGKPWMAIEIKSSEESIHPGLKYLLERQPIPYAFQLHWKGENDWFSSPIHQTRVRFMPIGKFLSQLP